MRVNKKTFSRLQGNASKTAKNFSTTAVKIATGIALVTSLTVGMTEPVFAFTYPDYAYVPYNQNWGNKDAFHKLSIQVSNGMGVIQKEEASRELLAAIYDCLGEKKIENSKYNVFTFQLIYNSSSELPIIDRSSFAFYKKKISTLKPLQTIDVYLPVRTFMAPDGQQWVDEKNYMVYASNMNIIYQCSDGTLAHSYQEFKDWECELAYRPSKPIYPVYPECTKTLSEIGYLELSSDGTIWKDQTLLEEYLRFRQDKNYGVKDGIYFGAYGICSSFEDYVRRYNVSYYVNAGLRREEQFYGAHGFLYISGEKAQSSIDKLNGYQKRKDK